MKYHDRSFHVTVESDWACTWVIVRGDVDAAATLRMAEVIDEVVADRPRKLQLVLNRVTSVDAAGAMGLTRFVRAARHHSPRVVVRGAPPTVRWMLDDPDAHLSFAMGVAQVLRLKVAPLRRPFAVAPASTAAPTAH